MKSVSATRNAHGMRRLIVVALERVCGVIDDLPGVGLEGGRPHLLRHSQFGCYPLRLALLSAHLDERWATGVWTESADHNLGYPE